MKKIITVNLIDCAFLDALISKISEKEQMVYDMRAYYDYDKLEMAKRDLIALYRELHSLSSKINNILLDTVASS